jgi:hypothetical protein
MAQTIDNQVTQSSYIPALTIQDYIPGGGGFANVINADVYVQLQFGPQGQGEWSDEYHVPIGTVAIPTDVTGIRFRSYSTTAATVTAALFAKYEPQINLGAGGQNTSIFVTGVTLPEGTTTLPLATVSKVQWIDSTSTEQEYIAGRLDPVTLHHQIDFVVDTGGEVLIWDDRGALFGANYIGVGISLITGLSISQTGTRMDNTGLFLAVAAASTTVFMAAVTSEANARFTSDNTGLLSWGPGGGTAIGDVNLSRTASGVLTAGGSAAIPTIGSGATFGPPQATTGSYIAANGTVNCVVATSTTNTIAVAVGNNTDTASRFLARPDRLEWGPGTARDTFLARDTSHNITHTNSGLALTATTGGYMVLGGSLYEGANSSLNNSTPAAIDYAETAEFTYGNNLAGAQTVTIPAPINPPTAGSGVAQTGMLTIHVWTTTGTIAPSFNAAFIFQTITAPGTLAAGTQVTITFQWIPNYEGTAAGKWVAVAKG